MAQISARMPIICKRTVTEEGKVAFSGGVAIGKMITTTVTPAQNNVKLYGDDAVAEKDNGVTSAAITLNTTHIPSKAAPLMFGAKYIEKTDTEPEQVIFKDGDEGEVLGYAYIDGHKENSKNKFRVVLIPYVTFTLPAETSNTKGETVAFTTPSVSGTAEIDPVTGEWRHYYYFDTAAAAIEFIKELTGYGVTAEPANAETDNADEEGTTE